MSFNPWILTFYLIVTSNSQSWLLDVIHIIFHVIIIPFYLIIITFYLIIVTVYHAIVLFSILCHFLSNTFDSHLIMMTFFHNDTRMFFFQQAWFCLVWLCQSAQPTSLSVWWVWVLQQTLLHAAMWRMRTPATVTTQQQREKCQECHKQVAAGGKKKSRVFNSHSHQQKA